LDVGPGLSVASGVGPPRRDTRFEAGGVAHPGGPYEELLRLLLSPVVATLG